MREWVEVRIVSSMDAGELLGMLDDPAAAGAWEENGVIHLYWPGDRWTADAQSALTRLLEPPSAILSVRTLPDEDWNAAWARSVKPIRIGQRIVVRPSWEPASLRPGDVEVILDPKQAFGTGHHATTQLLLERLQASIHGGERVLDVGTGSGILAMAALKLGAASALAIDNDPVAVDCAKGYAAENGCGPELDLRVAVLDDLDRDDRAGVTIVLANLDRKTLLGAAPSLGVYLRQGARLLLSGLLAEDRADVTAAYERVGGTVVLSWQREGWLALELLQPEPCEGT